MKSKSFKNIIEVLPMKKGETLANVKTKVNLSHIPEEMTANLDADVLYVFLNKITGHYLGYIKLVYTEIPVKILGINGVKRVAHVEISELSTTIQEDAYVKLLNRFLYGQAKYGKFVNYIHVDRKTLSDRMDFLFSKTMLRPMRGNSQILELNVELHLIICLLVIIILL